MGSTFAVSTLPGSPRAKDGQPVPDENLSAEENNGVPQPAQLYIPSRYSFRVHYILDVRSHPVATHSIASGSIETSIPNQFFGRRIHHFENELMQPKQADYWLLLLSSLLEDVVVFVVGNVVALDQRFQDNRAKFARIEAGEPA